MTKKSHKKEPDELADELAGWMFLVVLGGFVASALMGYWLSSLGV